MLTTAIAIIAGCSFVSLVASAYIMDRFWDAQDSKIEN